MSAAHRWGVLAGVLAATLAAAAWVRSSTEDTDSAIVAAVPADKGSVSAGAPSSGRSAPAPSPAMQVHLEKLSARSPGTPVGDPFALPVERVHRPARAAAKARPAPAPRPSAPPMPFTYMGKLRSGDDTAVFLTQGDRNLILHEGDTIDSVYRVEHIADSAITLLYLPLQQRQTIAVGEPP